MSDDERADVLNLGGLSLVEEDVVEQGTDAGRVGFGVLSILVMVGLVAVIVCVVVFLAIVVTYFWPQIFYFVSVLIVR